MRIALGALHMLREVCGPDAVAAVASTDDATAHQIVALAYWVSALVRFGESGAVVRGAVRALVAEIDRAQKAPRRLRAAVKADRRRLHS